MEYGHDNKHSTLQILLASSYLGGNDAILFNFECEVWVRLCLDCTDGKDRISLKG